jgi:hypothetical protein
MKRAFLWQVMGIFLILAFAFALGAVQAQERKPTLSSGAGATGAPVVNNGPGIVLWDQPLSAVDTAAYVDQDFETGFDTYDAFLADDFTNTAFWVIKTIYVPGDSWNGSPPLTCATSLNFYIYTNSSGVPSGYPDGGLGGLGSPVWSLSVLPSDPQVTLSLGVGGYLTVVTLNLTTPIALPPGTYWLVFYPEMSFGSCGQYGRQVSDTTNGYQGKWINPGDGFGYGATSWMDSTTLTGASQTDLAFRFEGIEYLPIFDGSDFDGNMTSDIAVFRPSAGMWTVKNQFRVYYGLPGDIPVPGDYNDDGTTDIAVYRPSTGKWAVKGQFIDYLGGSTDVPVPGDYDGDGDTDIAVFDVFTGHWRVRNQLHAYLGTMGDIPVPADYDGDGDTDIAVFDAFTGHWRVRNQLHAYLGTMGDIPVPADYNGDNRAEVAIFRPATGMWVISGQPRVFYGSAGDIPVPGDYDGDGDTDIAVFRPSNNTWYIRGMGSYGYGAYGDVPVVRGK